MNSTAKITDAEFRVLQGAWEHPSGAYQPSAELLDTANQLLRRGLVQKRADFPDVLVTTEAGDDVYQAEAARRITAREDA